MKRTSIDLLHGPIVSSLLAFAWPLLLSNIFQQLYNTADIMIVGRFLGSDALAAVGATAAIFDLIIGFALGVGNGMGIVIARAYGAKEEDQLKKAVAASLLIGLGLSGAVMLLGHVGLYPLLEFLGTPSAIIDQSYQYISLIVLCVAVTFAYNLAAGLLRAVGDSLAALSFLIFSALLNIVLDLYFITQLQLGIQSAAIATILSQALSALLCFFYIRKKMSFLVPTPHHFVWDKSLYVDLVEQGLAMGLMTSIVSIGTVILQSSINALGATIISAQTTARRVMSFMVLPITAIATAITTFTSQNFGAKQAHRILRGIRIAVGLSVSWALLASLILYFASPALNQLISSSTDPLLIHSASDYLRITSIFYPVLAVLLILRNSLQGLGRKMTPLISSFIELTGKILFVWVIIPYLGYLGVILCEPFLWIPMTIQLYWTFRHHPLIKMAQKGDLIPSSGR
ncbi:MATE family efflux transporter [Streptococcus sp. DD13]|uniref:MATE family efflux transporter n=1 Tax=Streptococcus sp. DD13 TaxID=1777881 RepID=UPI00079B339E|nr:MATE family efflux transporter [Streptococcus sp. DD13]KXT77956.1 Multi antimicrobial extrusion protein (Na(+)/drug antiporter), MDR efflux pum MATE family [Streptococcus sp. DD13]